METPVVYADDCMRYVALLYASMYPKTYKFV